MVERRSYRIAESITFAKVHAKYGVFSNMCGNMSLFVNDVNIPSSEALYQACKFPLFPKIQHEILIQSNAMLAKKVSKKYEKFVRQDWNEIRFRVMKWCLHVKILQNWDTFSKILIKTGEKPIVEYSLKDPLWGASPDGNGNLIGVNALGRLLMALRVEIKHNQPLQKVIPPNIDGFLLYGNQIETVYTPKYILSDL